MPLLISSMLFFTESAAWDVDPWMNWINSTIWAIDWLVCSASFLTSPATTAKPRPCSPARAASMEAFSDRSAVWFEISEMTFTISPISLECAVRRSISVAV
ncbi:hypothetical protein D3C81_1790070 [compost metagenome]